MRYTTLTLLGLASLGCSDHQEQYQPPTRVIQTSAISSASGQKNKTAPVPKSERVFAKRTLTVQEYKAQRLEYIVLEEMRKYSPTDTIDIINERHAAFEDYERETCGEALGRSMSGNRDRLAFYKSNYDSITDDLLVMDKNGTVTIFSHPEISIEDTRLSPDGNYVGISYMLRDDLLTRLAGVVNVETGELTHLGTPDFMGSAPAVCNAGQKVAFKHRKEQGPTELYLYENGKGNRKVEYNQVLPTSDLAISPDCSKVGFVYSFYSGAVRSRTITHNLCIITLDKSRLNSLGQRLAGETGVVSQCEWLPALNNQGAHKNPRNFDRTYNLAFSEDGNTLALRNLPNYTIQEDFTFYLGDWQTREVVSTQGRRETWWHTAKASMAQSDRVELPIELPSIYRSYEDIPSYFCNITD